MPVLHAAVGGPAGRAGARVVYHVVRGSHVELPSAGGAAVADGGLAVPVGVLHQVEHHNGPVHGEVVLPVGAPQVVDAAAGLGAGDVRHRLPARLALVVAGAVVAGYIHIVPLALSVPTVRVGGRS